MFKTIVNDFRIHKSIRFQARLRLFTARKQIKTMKFLIIFQILVTFPIAIKSQELSPNVVFNFEHVKVLSDSNEATYSLEMMEPSLSSILLKINANFIITYVLSIDQIFFHVTSSKIVIKSRQDDQIVSSADLAAAKIKHLHYKGLVYFSFFSFGDFMNNFLNCDNKLIKFYGKIYLLNLTYSEEKKGWHKLNTSKMYALQRFEFLMITDDLNLGPENNNETMLIEKCGGDGQFNFVFYALAGLIVFFMVLVAVIDCSWEKCDPNLIRIRKKKKNVRVAFA